MILSWASSGMLHAGTLTAQIWPTMHSWRIIPDRLRCRHRPFNVKSRNHMMARLTAFVRPADKRSPQKAVWHK